MKGGKRDDDADDQEGKEANVSEKRNVGRFFFIILVAATWR